MSKLVGLIILSILFSVIDVNAQKTEVSGKVTEAGSKNTIPYVSIYFKGTFTGTMSDLNGNYNLSSTKPGTVVEFSAVGYKPKEFTIKLNKVNKLDVSL